MAGRNTLKLDLTAFQDLLVKLEGLDGDVKEAATEALNKAGEKIGADTQAAMSRGFLPAGGKYSQGDTENAVVLAPAVEWSGTEASIGVGFDYGKPGAGGFLITGTPRMRPNYKLAEIYTRKRYMKEIQEEMTKVVNERIQKAMEG